MKTRMKTRRSNSAIPPSIPKRKRSGLATQSTNPSSPNASLDNDVNHNDVDHQSDGLLPDVPVSELPLDCPIFKHPLSAPVFQCMNWHVICSDCCTQVKKKCPSCKRKTGKIRCRAIESLLETIKIPCGHRSYGCLEEVSYASRNSHESTCPYKPYGCPFCGCDFVGTHVGLFPHMRTSHTDSVVSLQLGQVCRFSMGTEDKLVAFREEVDGNLFFFNKLDRMSISCIGSGDDHRFSYALVVRGKDTSIRFQSVTTRFQNGGNGVGIGSSRRNFIQLPRYLCDRDVCFLEIQVCIWSKGSPPVDIAGALL